MLGVTARLKTAFRYLAVIKYSAYIIFLLLNLPFAFAQSQQAELEALTNHISQRIVLNEDVDGTFVQHKFIKVLPRPLISRGKFSFSGDEGLDWLTQQPIQSRLMFDDKGIRQEMDGKMLWQIEAEQPAVAMITRVIVSVLALDWQTLDDYFIISGSYNDNQWQIELVPKEQVLLQIIESLAVSGDQHLEKMVLFEANEDRTEISFAFDNTNSP